MYQIEIVTPNKNVVLLFTNKATADTEKKLQIKQLGLKRQKGFWGNPKTGTEITTNY